jgi:outer membrane protein assembly factor BamB
MTLDNPAKGTGEMVALDLATGDVAWQRKLPASPYGAASVVNDLVFTTTFDGTLWAFDTESGEVVWKEQLPGGTNAPVTIDGDTLITAATFGSEEAPPEIIAYRLGGGPSAGGGEEPPGDGGEEPPGGGGEEPPGGGGEQVASGAELFDEHCASCHVLAAAGSTGTIGPNLDDVQPSLETVVSQVTNGGGGMPAFGNSLSEAEIQAIAEYVSSSAGKGGGGGGGGGGAGSATP